MVDACPSLSPKYIHCSLTPVPCIKPCHLQTPTSLFSNSGRILEILYQRAGVGFSLDHEIPIAICEQSFLCGVEFLV